MAYVRPQVIVFQDFRRLPQALQGLLRACIVGPHGKIHRFDFAVPESDENNEIFLGEYDYLTDVSYAWPNRTANSKIDLTSVQVVVNDALLEYFVDLIGSGSTLTPVSGRTNEIQSNTVIFASGNGFNRSILLNDRDVRPGDVAYVRGVVGGTPYELWTEIQRVRGVTVPSSVSSATSDPNNKPTQSGGLTVTKTGGPDNCVALTVDATNYNGLRDGFISDTYTLEVIAGSTGSDFTTALVRVTTASGQDNVLNFVPAAAGTFKAVGQRGLQVRFDILNTPACSQNAQNAGVPQDDLVPGQKWTVVVNQAFTAPTATKGGTYNGPEDTTYIIEVVRGGVFADSPLIAVTTTTGIDASGPTAVTAANTSVAVGTYGVTVSFNHPLRKGDKYYIPVTAAKEGARRILQFTEDLPSQLLSATDLELRLYIRDVITLPQKRPDTPVFNNWTANQTEIVLKANAHATHSTWTLAGVEQPLPLKGGSVYVQYREWLSDLCNGVGFIDDPDDIPEIFGEIHPDNPLAFAISLALANSNGVSVGYVAVCDPDDVDSWAQALDAVGSRDDVYGIVPLTFHEQVQNLVAAHVEAFSGPDRGNWRAAYLSLPTRRIVDKISKNTSSDGNVVLAVLEDDPAESGNQYRRLRLTSGNAGFLTNGVKAGDEIRFLFDSAGNYTTFRVKQVVSETTVIVDPDHTGPVTTPQKVEVWHTLTNAEIVDDVGSRAAAFGSSRICAIWPDRAISGGFSVEGYYLASAIAGLRSGSPPQQSLTNVEITGFSKVIMPPLSQSQLDDLASQGVWLVVQDTSGRIYTRHALTTDMTDTNTREESVRTNVDSMSYVFLNSMKPFIGRTNITPETIDFIRVQLNAVLSFLKSSGLSLAVGPQLIEGTVAEIRQHEVFKDRLIAIVNLVIPYPMNVIELHLVI